MADTSRHDAAKQPLPLSQAVPPAAGGAAPPTVPPRESFLALRREVSLGQAIFLGALCIALIGTLWWFLTWGEPEERILSPGVFPSPAETFGDFPSLWFDNALTRNTLASLRRVALGFALAALIGIPLGILCGCFPWMNAFFSPVTIMGRNIPVAALIPLTFSLFGIGELQKVMFIFIATAAFVIIDTAAAIRDVSDRYVDTAYTLGAHRWQIISKVLTPLAMPRVFNSLRLLFGLAFGYIMLAEVIQMGGSSGGLGGIINRAQSRGGRETHILLVLMVIPLVALAIDRILFWIQRQLFPHQYGGAGLLRRALAAIRHTGEDLKGLVVKPVPARAAAFPGPGSASPAAQSEGRRP
ncbi:MAG: ABC transporter permease subunit [Pirellulales bacterium]|nr:ABC transporter permease subunit [Pirellulales bacterium]